MKRASLSSEPRADRSERGLDGRRRASLLLGAVTLLAACASQTPEPQPVTPPPVAPPVPRPSPEPVATSAPPPAPAPVVTAPVDPPPPAAVPPSPADDRPRVYAPEGLVRIYDQPDRDAPVIGAMRAGQSVVLKDTTLRQENTDKRLYQCDSGWYPVEPRGWVCVGGPTHATLDGKDPRVIASRAALPDLTKDYPFHYGVSVGTPQYLRIPTKAEQLQSEPDLASYLQNPPADDPSKGGAVDRTPAGEPPPADFLAYQASAKPALLHEQEAYEGYKISWTRQFDANGRTWLLTPDMTLVPKDRVRQKPLPTLKGVDLRLHPEMKLPLAFFWLEDSFKYREGADGKLQQTEEVIPRHSFVEATMNQRKGPGGIYWQMRSGDWIRYQDVTMIRPREARLEGVGPEEKWVEVRVTWGYLIAYEGDKPVYVTAMSPGVDGIANRAHATARGRHNVDWKMFSGDMSGRDKGKDWFVDEVPWVQYYKGNYAFHGAWWHNDFGRPKSHGCVNLSPPDAHFLFQWMDPAIPEGWYAVSVYYPHVVGTKILIRH